jgi:hypothetical protein
MPSKSPAQARMMAAAAHDPAFAKKVGVPQSVASEYNQTDKGGKMLKQAMQARALRRK